MIDQGEQDDKIIGVHADDPEYKEYTDISELPAHRLAEIKRCKKYLCADCLLQDQAEQLLMIVALFML